MQRLRWDSAKLCLRDAACALSSAPLTFWSWLGASESLCPSAVLPVTLPKPFYFLTSDPRTWWMNVVWTMALLPGSRKCDETLGKHLSSVNGSRFSSQDTLFCTCCLPKTDSICSLCSRSSSQFRICVSLTVMEAKQGGVPKTYLEPAAGTRCCLPFWTRISQVVLLVCGIPNCAGVSFLSCSLLGKARQEWCEEETDGLWSRSEGRRQCCKEKCGEAVLQQVCSPPRWPQVTRSVLTHPVCSGLAWG